LVQSAPKHSLPAAALNLVADLQGVAKEVNLVAETLSLARPYLEVTRSPVALVASSKAIGYRLLLTEQQLVNYEAQLRHMRFHSLRPCLSDQVSLLDGIVFQAPPPEILTSIYARYRLQEQLFQPAQWGSLKRHASVLCQNNQ
jgi:hypothetical protein